MRHISKVKRKTYNRAVTGRAVLIRLISTGVATLGIDEDTMREMFFTITRKRSRREMDAHELESVLSHLRSIGFTEVGGNKTITNFKQYMRLLWSKLAQAGKVDADTVAALNSWVSAQTRELNGGVGIASYTMVGPKLGRDLIERLKQWLGRV